MKNLEDDRRIRDLNAIPKSHDSGAVHPYKCLQCLPWQWAKCQNKFCYTFHLNYFKFK